MKKLVIGVAVIAAAGGCFPFFAGLKAEANFYDNLPAIKEQAAMLGLQLEQSAFERGFWSNQASIRFVHRLSAGDAKPLTVHIHSSIQNGPLLSNGPGIYATASQLSVENLPPDVAKLLPTDFDNIIVSEHSTLNFMGDLAGEMEFKPVTFNDAQGSVVFNGGTIAYKTDMAFDGLLADLTIKPIEVANQGWQVAVADIVGKYDLERLSGNIYLGDTSMRIAEINISNDGADYSLKGLSMDSVLSDSQHDKLMMTQTIAVKQIESPLPIQSAAYSLVLNHVDSKALALYQEMTAQLQQSAENPQSFAEKFSQQKLRELAAAFFQKGLQLNQQLTVNIQGKANVAKVDLEFIGTKDNKHVMDIEHPAEALLATNADIHIEVAEEVVMMTPLRPQVTRFIQQGVLAKNNGLVIFSARLDEGKATIAGKPFPLEGYFLPAGKRCSGVRPKGGE